jgi:hypothetical protein
VYSFAETIRSWLPWQWRAVVTPWLIISAICALAAPLFLGIHFWAREKPKINWLFYNVGTPITLGARWNEGVAAFVVDGVQFSGANISGHTLHQVDAEITLLRTGKKLPLFVIIDAQWMPTEQIESVPPNAFLTLGGQFRGDGTHWPEYGSEMTPNDFLRDFGAFSVSITIDGDKKTWSFTIDELREQLDRLERAEEERWLQNPLNRPRILRKGTRS